MTHEPPVRVHECCDARVDLRERLDEFKQSQRSVRPAEMHALLLAAGFSRRYGKGDHWVYTHAALRFALTIDPKNPLRPSVSKAVRAIEEARDDVRSPPHASRLTLHG